MVRACSTPRPSPFPRAGLATMTDSPTPREVPFNYTSADDRQAISQLFGPAVWQKLEELRGRRVTGRSARLLMRFFGEILVHRRNPFLFQELVGSRRRRGRFFANVEKDLGIVQRNANGEPRVLAVLEACRSVLDGFRRDVEGAPELRRRMLHDLGRIAGKGNVLFDPFTLVSHSTDATDWRLHLPVAVVMPDDEAQLAPLLAAIARLRLKAIPRGAGTGLTGGAVPLRPGCVVVNTEKLNRIRGVSARTFRVEGGREVTAQILEVEAGVVTEHAMQYAAERGLVFATDPTSAWACTIGGNIAENAGGKDCVLYGTCIDNLLSWRMAMPSGRSWTIRRVDHPLRKILPEDLVAFDVEDEEGRPARRIELRGAEIRKKGLWKDITNKALGGLPGLQKEGTDGVIGSAEFVLHPEWEASRTLCLEFFGPDFDEASRVILELSRSFAAGGRVALSALEHFDAEYVRAIDYEVKATRAETPKAVLLVDVVGRSAADVSSGVATIGRILETHPNTAMFEARDAAEAGRFWADRKKLGAIARRTNAFKLNEDVVLPLEALAEFARWIEAVNVEEERYSQSRFVERAEEILAGAAAPPDDPEWLAAKIPAALELCRTAREALRGAGAVELRSLGIVRSLQRDVGQLVRGFPALGLALDKAHGEVRDRLVVLATHMHAGDGNVHVNVPVLSNDRPMLRRASEMVDRVMEKVIALGGVVSGEHGIGVTKLKYLEPERIAELSAHRREVDPGALMNPGKLEDLDVLDRIFTPSFNLLELEARILQRGQLEELARSIARCVRCGRCKPGCCVHHPARGMFFHPRNKNLAVGSLVEALLYDAQRAHSTRFELLRWLEEVADHCTICHKCLKPCPVDIDSGKVSLLERSILASWGYKRTPLATRAALRYLESRSPAFNRVFRGAVLRAGGTIQRAGCELAAPLQPPQGQTGSRALQTLRSPLARAPRGTLRDFVPRCDPDQVLVFEPEGEAATSVFYFPGCGSERYQSRISMAALHVLVSLGTRVVLPPPFLCCGYPAHVNARTEQHARHLLRDTILFSQIHEMFGYLRFDACVVTCGTCREGILAMDSGGIFGGRLVDLAAYAQERGLRLGAPADGGGHLYHAPCHDSLDGRAAAVLAKLGGFGDLEPVPYCCSEAGTLALSRPDISDAMLHRKRSALEERMGGRRGVTVLTSCPSCVNGLSRNAAMGVEPEHLAVALARRMSGDRWLEAFRAQAARAHAIQF